MLYVLSCMGSPLEWKATYQPLVLQYVKGEKSTSRFMFFAFINNILNSQQIFVIIVQTNIEC